MYDITVEETCGGCPHCIHFFDDNENEIGGIRYRWGHFQCWPVVNGKYLDNIIDTEGPKDRGILPYEYKDDIIDYCKECVVNWHNGYSVPGDADAYISELLNA